ncbi:helix-turn-helix domain-containing protein [Streptomyces sp. NPDC126499]|uniref:AraC-like ligand-binding domain-containing protein n=1 Tax=Streptomyces sp. NPDC126499 TaxID=3155314 RepID=UPI003320884F
MTVLDTKRLPVPERTGAWAEATASALVATHFTFPEPERFDARIRLLGIGDAQLAAMSYGPLLCSRTVRLIRRSDPELYQVAVIGGGRQGIDQAGHHTLLAPGQIVLYDSSRPFEARAGAGGGAASSLVLQFPRRSMPLPDKVVAPLCGTAIKGTDGVARVLRQTLRSLADPATELSDTDRVRLGTTVIDLAAAVVARHAEQTALLPRESRTGVLRQEVLAFIGRNLRDPELTPASIAEAHCVSTRTLHRAFEGFGETVGEVVRRERINRCRRDLADPALRNTPVAAIGARWGFARASDFTRAFRNATGLTPTAYRAEVRCR